MNAVRVKRRLDASLLKVAELAPMVGKVVEIIVLEDERNGNGMKSAAPSATTVPVVVTRGGYRSPAVADNGPDLVDSDIAIHPPPRAKRTVTVRLVRGGYRTPCPSSND